MIHSIPLKYQFDLEMGGQSMLSVRSGSIFNSLVSAILITIFLSTNAWSSQNMSPAANAPASPSSTPTDKKGTPNASGSSDDGIYNSEVHRSFLNLIPDAPPPGYSTLVSRWLIMLYGFIELDAIHDSTNSFNNWPFNSGAANSQTVETNALPPTTNPSLGQTVDHPAFGFDANNSRLGFAISSPRFNQFKVRGILEMDFLNTPGECQYGGAFPCGNNSGPGLFQFPVPRIRLAFMDISTKHWGNLLVGQYWSLFGWRPYYMYNSLQIVSGPGSPTAWFPQIRYYRIFHFSHGNKSEVAASVMMPPSESTGVPVSIEGVKWANTDWMGEDTLGNSGKGPSPLSIGLTDVQTIYSGSFIPSTGGQAQPFYKFTSAYSIDLLLPIIPIHDGSPGNNLSLAAEYTYGQGDAWLFPNLTFGLGSYAGTAGPTGVPIGGLIPPGNGILMGNAFAPLGLQTFYLNLQYYFPDQAKTWISTGFSADIGTNLQSLANTIGPTKLGGAVSSNGLYKYVAPWTRNTFTFFDVDHDLTPAVRVALEYGVYNTLYTTGINASDQRIMMSWFYFF
ncbi:MAG: hypothetical protein ACYCTV_11060 [Leptospirales bacterium]